MVYITEVGIEIITFFGHTQYAYMHKEHPNFPIKRKYDLELTVKFRKTGSVVNRKAERKE